jgi:quercetin dioxygenase-like cupin family protein
MGLARAQDPVKVAPGMYKVLFENDDARVIEVTGKPGDKSAKHSHPDHVVYAITAGKVKFTGGDGKSKEVSMKAGEVLWSPGETHESELIEGKDFKVVVIELKESPAGGAKPSKLADADDQAKSSADITKVLLDNDRVRVLETRLKPGGKLPKHAHPAHAVYAFTPAKVKFTTYPDEKTSEKSMEAGQAFVSGPVTHVVENVGTTDAHSLLVEIK